jgi:alanyl-tRNA synthetase
LIADGVLPGNKDQGYILRRLIRRATRYYMGKVLLIERDKLAGIVSALLAPYQGIYDVFDKQSQIVEVIYAEITKFGKTLAQGLKEFEKGTDPFLLATSYGFPIELTEELASEKGMSIDRAKFDADMKAHQDASRAGAEQKFKGGLANTTDMTVRLHTAHHLLLAALQKVLGPEVKQKGSNITEERLRLDFNFDRKMTDEEKKAVEDQVNQWIAENHTVCKREMPRADAEALGAEMEFGTKYPDVVSVYFIEDKHGVAVSKEFCGGPHVTETASLGTFSIQKEEASSAGIRRIKAILS